MMKLDEAAQKALNLFPNKAEEPAHHSLYGLLNKCKTPMGKRLLRGYLQFPLTDLRRIETRLNVVEGLISDSLVRNQIQRVFRGQTDIEKLLMKLKNKTTQLPELFQLYEFSSALPYIIQAFRQHEGPHKGLFQTRYVQQLELCHDEDHLDKFEKLIETAIDPSKLPDEYFINSDYDPQLQELSVKRNESEDRVTSGGLRIARELNLEWNKTIKLDWFKSNNTQRRCVRVTLTQQRTLSTQLQQHFIILETQKGAVKFTNEELNDAAEELRELTRSYDEIQQRLVRQVTEIASTFLEVFKDVVQIVAEIDVLCAFAFASISAPVCYTRPKLNPPEIGYLNIQGGRHPLLEVQEGVVFVKNDCCLVHGQSWFQVITGPNMGGKSTFIRQVGMIVLMAQIGCFVPCEDAEIPIRDAIFARVGADDCLQRGFSTFMMEMQESASILNGATGQSLVIVDELGRGTSTCDGFGLAWAISEYLITKIGAPSLVATHFTELTKIQGPVGVKNLHAEATADPENGRVIMQYKIKDGACERSFGIQIMKMLHFPVAVTYLAQRRLQQLEGGTEESKEINEVEMSVGGLEEESKTVLTSGKPARTKLKELKELLKPIEGLLSSQNINIQS